MTMQYSPNYRAAASCSHLSLHLSIARSEACSVNPSRRIFLFDCGIPSVSRGTFCARMIYRSEKRGLAVRFRLMIKLEHRSCLTEFLFVVELAKCIEGFERESLSRVIQQSEQRNTATGSQLDRYVTAVKRCCHS